MTAESNYQLQALPPIYQEEKEKQAILNDPRLKDLQERISIIREKFNQDGSKNYTVQVGEFLPFTVTVIYTNQEGLRKLGPRAFELQFPQPIREL